MTACEKCFSCFSGGPKVRNGPRPDDAVEETVLQTSGWRGVVRGEGRVYTNPPPSLHTLTPCFLSSRAAFSPITASVRSPKPVSFSACRTYGSVVFLATVVESTLP